MRQAAPLLLGLLLGSAAAQSAATPSSVTPSPAAYRTMQTALDKAVQVRAASKVQSLNELQRAQNSFDTFKSQIRSPLLAKGLNDTLSAARASLARSPADLEAQVTQARGLMRAVLYDQTLGQLTSAAATTQSSQAKQATQNHSRLLAGEFGVTGAAASTFVKTVGNADLGAAQRTLQQAAARKVQGYLGAVNLADRASAYLNLSRAASWFTAVQTAPTAGSLQLSAFAEALGALGSGDAATARSSLADLKSGAAAFVQASSGRAPVAAAPSKPAPTSSVRPAVPTKPKAPAAAVVSAPRASSADPVYAALGRALSAASVADLPAARQALAGAQQALTAASKLRQAESYAALSQDIGAASLRSGLRPGDVQALIGQLGNVEAQATGQPSSTLHASAASIARNFSGAVRAMLFLLLAALAISPLYLLNLAFGNRNPYWRAILFGLLLLLLPAFLEGIGGFLGWLGDLSGVAAFRSLTNLSLLQNAWGGPIWALSLAAALGALIYGLRGLCVQFGLIGQTRPAPSQPSAPGNLEWDEDV
ncbi:hypothetical protein [Deinococcus sp.]|uniref:hypothetical protein n=1 Tax=Deinococcus sp. TaxID=47478 RepID=UPI003B5C0CD8